VPDFALLDQNGRSRTLTSLMGPKGLMLAFFQTYGIPFPGTFMLNVDGVVTSRFFEPAYQERSTINSIMAHLGRDLEVPATIVESPQLTVTSFATDRVVAPGTHFSIVLDVRPGRGMHVYAPGHWIHTNCVVDRAAALRHRSDRTIPDAGGVPLQAAQRARSRVSTTVLHRARSGGRRIAERAGRIEGQDRFDDKRRAELPRLRREGVLHTAIGSPHVER
jgi:hypothetical protein